MKPWPAEKIGCVVLLAVMIPIAVWALVTEIIKAVKELR